jgi:ribosome biogenesis GTPase
MPGAHAFEQIIAANLDLAVPVFAAAQPEPKWGMLDRYLVSAEASQIPALICINKIDLIGGQAEENELLQTLETYRRIGYPIVVISARTGEGIDNLTSALEGKVSAFLGKSGVGKTSLLNRIQPGLGQRVHEVSQATGKGRHTTTHLEMFPLDSGGAVVDTPGVREFGLWDIAPEELAWMFPEMRPMLGKCHFRLDCLHDEEPGCAVREGVTAGRISPFRYRSYVRLLEEP